MERHALGRIDLVDAQLVDRHGSCLLDHGQTKSPDRRTSNLAHRGQDVVDPTEEVWELAENRSIAVEEQDPNCTTTQRRTPRRRNREPARELDPRPPR
jgi:hypothetical protein